MADDAEAARRSTRPPFRPTAILETLGRHNVRFILIGGVAERLLGSPRGTGDIDICPARDRANLARLADALNELEAVFRPPGLESGFPPPQPWDGRSFGSFTGRALTTRFGWLDLWFVPDGTGGYSDLAKNAIEVEVRARPVLVASLDDIIRNKEAVGGLKYLTHLGLLRELRDRRRLRGE